MELAHARDLLIPLTRIARAFRCPERDVNIKIINSVCICERVILVDMRLELSMELNIV